MKQQQFCRNWRCEAPLGGDEHVLCPSCQLAGYLGMAFAGLVGFVLKLLGVL